MSRRRACALSLLGALAAPLALAADDAPAWKLTAGRYAMADGNVGLDANLRATRGAHTGWIGSYRERDGLRQARAGYEWRPRGRLRSVWSLQSASGGVWVGSVTAEVDLVPRAAGAAYLLAGFGRTNGRPYINLNYDPNDAITLGLGSRAWAGHEWLLFNVHDDRWRSGQNAAHAVWRWHLDGEQRLTVDVSQKRGQNSEGVNIRGNSWSLGYDRGAGFVRVTDDPWAGFGPVRQRRVQAGWRF